MNNEKLQPAVPPQQVQGEQTQDRTGVCFMTRIKITDPETGQVLLQMRGDE